MDEAVEDQSPEAETPQSEASFPEGPPPEEDQTVPQSPVTRHVDLSIPPHLRTS